MSLLCTDLRAYVQIHLQIASAGCARSLYYLALSIFLEGYYSGARVCVTPDADPIHDRSILISGKFVRHLHALTTFLAIKLNFLHLDCHCLFQRIFLTQGLNPHLLD